MGRLAAAAALALAAAACSRQPIIEKIARPDIRAFADRTVAALQACDAGQLNAALAPELRPRLLPALPQMCAATPPGPHRLVDASLFIQANANARRTFLSFEIDQGRRHALVRVGVLTRGDASAISDLYVNTLATTAEEATAFRLSGKSPLQYAFLALAILAPLLSLFALVRVVMARGLRWKWLWAVGCLVGLGQFAVDWSTGAVGFAPLSVQLLSGFVLKQGMLGSWRVGFAIPVVAILALVLRPWRRAEAQRRRAEARSIASFD